MANDDGAVTQPVADEVTNAPEAPVVEEAQTATEPSEPEAVETAGESQEPSQEETAATNEGAEAPEDEEEPPVDIDFGQYYNPGQPQIPVAEDGTVDPYQLLAIAEQRMEEKMRFQQQEARMWQAVEKKHPELANDKDAREILLNQRIANAIQGKETNMNKLADKLFGRTKEAKAQGRAEATTSRTIQKAASLETSTANKGEERSDDRLERLANGDKSAATAIFDQWLTDGKI